MQICVAIIIRTLNEGRHLNSVLSAINNQDVKNIRLKIIIVDSGSTDDTVIIANKFNANVIKIRPEDFTYGYALNIGFKQVLDDDIAVCLSGHCIPKGKYWLKRLIAPIVSGESELSFGSHLGAKNVRTSEQNYFKYKFYKLKKGLCEPKYFNNGNSAIKIKSWQENPFDEHLRAQEDVEMAIRVSRKGGNVFFVPSAAIVHAHEDTNISLLRRVLKEFDTELSINAKKPSEIIYEAAFSCYMIKKDLHSACRKKVLRKALPGIIKFRVMIVIAAFLACSKNFFKRGFGR